jgi:hypothetical protein
MRIGRKADAAPKAGYGKAQRHLCRRARVIRIPQPNRIQAVWL